MATFLIVSKILSVFVFTLSGLMKATISKSNMVKLGQTGVEDLKTWQIRSIGIMETVGAIAIIYGSVFKKSDLVALAAFGFVIIMFLAAMVHFRRKEYKVIAVNAFLMVLMITILIYG